MKDDQESLEPIESFDAVANQRWGSAEIELMGGMSRMAVGDLTVLIADKDDAGLHGAKPGVRIGRVADDHFRAVAVPPVVPHRDPHKVKLRTGFAPALRRLGWCRSLIYTRPVTAPYFWIDVGWTRRFDLAMTVNQTLRRAYGVELPWFVMANRVAMRAEARMWSDLIGRERFDVPRRVPGGRRGKALQEWQTREVIQAPARARRTSAFALPDRS